MSGRSRVAIGLGYDPEINSAPQVLFKCEDDLMGTILELAAKYGVLVFEEATLASNLSKVHPGREIPSSLYYSVARVFHKLPK